MKSWFIGAAVWATAMVLCVSAPHAGRIKSVRIITPAWPGLTNADGSGLYFDLFRAVYEPAGVRVTFTIAPWKRGRKEVADGRADLLPAAYLTRDTPEFRYPAHPMDVDTVVAIFKRDKIDWAGPASMAGKKAVWKAGYNFQNYLDVVLDWEEIHRNEQGWLMVENDRVDLYLDILADIDAHIAEHRPDMARFGKETAFTIHTYPRFGASDRAERLIRIYDERMAALEKSGELAAIFSKWNRSVPRRGSGRDPKTVPHPESLGVHSPDPGRCRHQPPPGPDRRAGDAPARQQGRRHPRHLSERGDPPQPDPPPRSDLQPR